MQIELDGQAVYAATGGRPFEPGRPTIVFIHGGGADHTVWALQTRYFAHRGQNVLAVDLPGHGRTAGPALTTVAAMADWVIAFLDALDVDDAALVGHSMGSLVALDAAMRHGGRVRAMALLGTALPMAVADPLLDALLAHAVQPRFVYRHRWRLGDIVAWDNRCSMHRATDDYRGQARRMMRILIEGTAPA